MALKIAGKSWSCNNDCGFNCCSDLFLPVSPEQRLSLEKVGHFIVDSNYADFKWLGYHKAIKIEKISQGWRKLTPLKKYEFKLNQHLGKDMVFIEDKCKMLLQNNRCKIYRSRPQICRVADCPAFSKNQSIRWYGKQGVLGRWLEKAGK